MAAHGKPFVAGTAAPTIADFKLFAQPSVAFPRTNPQCIVSQELQDEIQAKIDAAPQYKAWFDRMAQELSAYLAAEQRPL